MPKSEVLIEMPEFEKKYNLAMVETEKVTSRVRPKQFLHIDEAECILCEGCVDICPWTVSYTHLTLPTNREV